MKISWSFYFGLILILSCQSKSSSVPPTEREITELLPYEYDISHGFSFSKNMYSPYSLETVRIIDIKSKAGEKNTFNIKVFTNGKYKFVELCMPVFYQAFTDTLNIEVKKYDETWVVKNSKHKFKFSRILY